MDDKKQARLVERRPTCEGCRFQKRKDCYQEMTLDVLARAKRLAGVEGQEASDD